MSNTETNQLEGTPPPVSLADLSAQLKQLQADQVMHTQQLTDVIAAIKSVPNDQAWASQRVRIADFDIPFGHLVGFMVKVAFASIPAAIIVAIIYFLVVVVGAALLRTGR